MLHGPIKTLFYVNREKYIDNKYWHLKSQQEKYVLMKCLSIYMSQN